MLLFAVVWLAALRTEKDLPAPLSRLPAVKAGSVGQAPGAVKPTADPRIEALGAVKPTADPRIVPSRRGFYVEPGPLAALDLTRYTKNMRFCIQQVVGRGDCLFHAIAVGLAFDEGLHLDMDDARIAQRATELRALAVDTLTAQPQRPLNVEGKQEVTAAEIVTAAAEQYGFPSGSAYCEAMRKPRVWGGGPEILALVNALERPIHVYEPVACEEEFRLRLCGAFGSPRFDARSPICIVAADDRFPKCLPTEVRLHGQGGGHFLALLPIQCPE